jgi:hypothetical protein
MMTRLPVTSHDVFGLQMQLFGTLEGEPVSWHSCQNRRGHLIGSLLLSRALQCDEGEDSEFIEMERKYNGRRVADEILLIERAKKWLLERGDS